VKRLLVVDTSVRLLHHSILVLSLYFLLAGHNQPGGGFVGGLTAGAAVSLRFVAGGPEAVRTAFRFRPWTILGTGLAVSVATALVPLLAGNAVLEHDDVSVDLPVLGTVKATSALPFDIGVYLVVLGLALMIFEAFGEEPRLDEPAGDRPLTAPQPEEVP
jgi:multicomponent Na+:H+ antiporter subunit A